MSGIAGVMASHGSSVLPISSNLVFNFDPNNAASYSGGTPYDVSPTATSGFKSGSFSLTAPYFSYVASGYSFAYFGDNTAYEPGSGNYSVEAWVYNTTIAGSAHCILTKTNSGGAASAWGYGLRTGSGGNTYMEVGNGTTSVTSPSYNVSLTTWYQIVGVWSMTPSKTIELFVNGVSQGSNSHTFTSVKDTAGVVSIGAYNGGEYSQYFDGRMGPIRMYSKALTAAEILQNFNANKMTYGL